MNSGRLWMATSTGSDCTKWQLHVTELLTGSTATRRHIETGTKMTLMKMYAASATRRAASEIARAQTSSATLARKAPVHQVFNWFKLAKSRDNVWTVSVWNLFDCYMYVCTRTLPCNVLTSIVQILSLGPKRNVACSPPSITCDCSWYHSDIQQTLQLIILSVFRIKGTCH